MEKIKMEKEKGYNGWSNYETWSCKLWIDNDEGLYDQIQEEVSRNQDTYKLQKYIKGLVNELSPELPASMYSDLLSSAISNIDFYEIAESLISAHNWRRSC